MLNKRVSILLAVLGAAGTAIAAEPPGVQIRTTRPAASVTLERSLADGKALVSVLDAKQEPVLGLTAKDFAVSRAGANAKVTSVQPIAQSVEVPRHVVLVLDNSDSMVARKAVPKLLEGVGAVLKAMRPVDDARIVVFHEKPTVKMGGRDLHVATFQSSKPADLEAFVAKAYTKGNTTETTVLYEAMVAGLELIKGMPVDDPRFLIVFTDGEDINSAFKSDVVSQVAQGVPNLRVFVIDHMPEPKIDPFLAGFAAQNHGQARKAGTGADLLTLFRQFASRLDQYYVVSYELPPPPAGQAPKPTEPPTAAAPQAAPLTSAAPAPETPTAAAPATPASTAPPPAPETSSNWWLWLLLLIVLILIVYFVSRKSDRK